MAAMSHWEASPFETKDGQDVVKAKGAHVVSEGWEKVVSKDSGGGSSGGSIVASLAAPLGVMPLIGDGSSNSLPHWQKAFLLLIGGFVVYYIRRLLRSKRRPARAAAVNEVVAPPCTALRHHAADHALLLPNPLLTTSHPFAEIFLAGDSRAAAYGVTRTGAGPAC